MTVLDQARRSVWHRPAAFRHKAQVRIAAHAQGYLYIRTVEGCTNVQGKNWTNG